MAFRFFRVKLPVKLIRWLMLVIMGLSAWPLISPAAAASVPVQVKELNLVFLHGAGGTSCKLQLLSDVMTEKAAAFISDYERANPGIKVQVNTLLRCYPNDADLSAWAGNVADAIDTHFSNRKDLVLIGHSMGGKAALYAVAHNKQLADKTAMVVTINSPVKNLDKYYAIGGGSAENFCRLGFMLSGQGVCNSIGSYDSSQDGSWVSRNKHWLAFISAESAPQSPQFDVGGVDGWPRDMDDGLVPISAQYADGADAIYYGEYGHSEFTVQKELAGFLANKILAYIFGSNLEYSILNSVNTGSFEHKAGWLPVKYSWDEVFGEVMASNGTISHANDSLLQWQNWEDVVIGDCLTGSTRSKYEVRLTDSARWLTGIKETSWLTPGSPGDCRLYIKTGAAPKNRVQVAWSIFRHETLPAGTRRDRYEIQILAGTLQTGIPQASWVTNDLNDVRLQVTSQAEGPFRWFQAQWKVYSKESRPRKIIDEIPARSLAGGN